MRIRSNDIRKRVSNLLDDAFGNILVFAGFLSLLIGFLFISPVNRWISVVTLFFGVVLLVSGLAIRLEGPLMLTKPSKSGFGTILVCVSLVMLASVGIFVLFETPTGIRLYNTLVRLGGYRPMETGTGVIVEVEHPLIWLVTPFATIGLGLLIVGVLLKVYDIF